MALRAVLFDLDGTLVDSERDYAEAIARCVARAFAITLTADDRAYGTGRSWVAIHAYLRARYPTLAWDRDQLIAATAAESRQLFAERGVEAAAVGHQARQHHAVPARHAARDLGGVGQLRDPLGADEAGDLDARQAAVDQRRDERDLVAGRDVARLVLQAVAGPDLVHGDARRELHADAPPYPAPAACATASARSMVRCSRVSITWWAAP